MTPEQCALASTKDEAILSRMSPEDREHVQRDLARATDYIKRYSWCTDIKERRYGGGVPGVIVVFLFRFDPPIGSTDSFLWLVSGDVPNAYFVVDPDSCNPIRAIDTYCALMRQWVDAIAHADRFDPTSVFPVDAPPTLVNAQALAARLETVQTTIIPHLRRVIDYDDIDC